MDVARFMRDAIRVNRGVSAESDNGTTRMDFSEAPRALRERIDAPGNILTARFELPVKNGVAYLNRTHPAVEAVAAYVMDSALDSLSESASRRAGVARTSQVSRRTTLLLVRFRYHIVTRQEEKETALLAEDCQIIAFAGSPQNAQWLEDEQGAPLLDARPEANVSPEQASDFVRKVVEGYSAIAPHLNDVAIRRGNELLDSHRRVRQASRRRGISQRVEPKLPPDVLGIYVFLPNV